MEMRILIAASGTGGHIFPGLHVAQALRELAAAKGHSIKIEFIGSGRPLEAKLIDSRGYLRHVIPVVGIRHRGVSGIFEFLTCVPRALLKLRQIYASPKVGLVIGMGGYTSVLPILFAWLKGIPTWIHEAELEAGLANKLNALFASKISVAFRDAKISPRRKTVWTGHPVRPDVLAVASMRKNVANPSRLLVMGGSQGADAIDSAMAVNAGFFAERGISIVHQCRESNIEKLKEAYAAAKVQAMVTAFINNPGDEYGRCDLVIARSGAGTLSELLTLGIPAILVPFPSKKIQQFENAKVLEQLGKAVILEEGPDLARRLRVELERLLDPSNYAEMVDHKVDLPSLDSSNEIARRCLELMCPNVV